MDTSETVSVRMATKSSFVARPKPQATPVEQLRAVALRMVAPLRQVLSARRRLLVGTLALVAVALIGSSALARVPRSSPRSTSDDPALPATPASALALEFASSTVASSVPRAVASATAPTAGAAGLAGSPNGTTEGTAANGLTAPTLVVHAAGAVTAPGVYRLADPARVTDVVAAAGGLTAEADPDVLNLAARVGDGERIFVPRRGQVAPGVVVGTTGVGAAGGSGSPARGGSNGAVGIIDLNAASAEQLDLLPGVGPAIATRIIEQRTRIGRFRSVNQLLDVPGIGEAKFATLKPRVKV